MGAAGSCQGVMAFLWSGSPLAGSEEEGIHPPYRPLLQVALHQEVVESSSVIDRELVRGWVRVV